MAQAVFCLARTEAQAIRIVDQLKAAGFAHHDISVLFPDTAGTRDFAHEQHTKAPEGAAAGAGTGGVLGGTLGWLVGIGALAIPGLGPFIAAGPIMAALSGAAAGAALGGLTGALIGLGIPEYEAERYEGKVKDGNLLISVHTEESTERARARQSRAGRGRGHCRHRRGSRVISPPQARGGGCDRLTVPISLTVMRDHLPVVHETGAQCRPRLDPWREPGRGLPAGLNRSLPTVNLAKRFVHLPMPHMRPLQNEHHGIKAWNDADSRSTLCTGVHRMYLAAPLHAQARSEVHTGISSRL